MDDGFYARFAKQRFAEVERAIADGLNRSITVESIDRIETGTEIRKYAAVDLVQPTSAAVRSGGKAAGVSEHDGAAGRGLRGP